MPVTLTAGGITFNDGTIQTTEGVGDASQSYQNVTSSRVKGTTYTNSTGSPILVVTNWGVTSIRQTYTCYVDGVIIMGNVTIYHYSELFTFVVPRGSTYMITGGGALVMNSWWELR